jgi:hypothetical protein
MDLRADPPPRRHSQIASATPSGCNCLLYPQMHPWVNPTAG